MQRKHLLEPSHDFRAALPTGRALSSLSGRETIDQRMDQALLEGARHLRVRGHVGFCLRETAGLPVQAPEAGTDARRWSPDCSRLWQHQVLLQQRLTIAGQIVFRQGNQAPATASSGALVNALAAAMKHHLAGLHFDTVPDREAIAAQRK